MEKTNLLKLPIYSGEDIFDLTEVNEAHKKIEYAYDTFNKITETNATAEVIDARGGATTIGEKIRGISSSLEQKVKHSDIVEANKKISVGFSLGARTIGVIDIEQLKEYKINNFRLDIKWDIVEKVAGVYDTSYYDNIINSLASNNITPLLVLCYENSLYCPNRAVTTEVQRKAFVNFAKAVANKYKDYKVIYEIWNEPNLEFFWNNQSTSPYYYTLLVKETYKAIKEIDKKNVVLGLCMSNTYRPETGGAFQIPTYAIDFCRYGGLDYLDGISLHPYTVMKPEDLNVYYNSYKTLLNHYGKDDMPLYVTEYGYPITPNWDMVSIKPLPSLSDEERGSFIIRSIIINAMNGIYSNTIHDYYSPQTNQGDSELWFSMFNSDKTPTRSATMLKEFLINLGDGEFLYCETINQSDYISFFKKSNGKVACFYWTTRNDHTVSYKGNELLLTSYPKYFETTEDILDLNNMSKKLKDKYVSDGSLELATYKCGFRNNTYGEIFNDYSNNFAEEYGFASGKFNLAYSSIMYTASYVDESTLSLSSIANLNIGDEIVINFNWGNYCKRKIVSIDTSTLKIILDTKITNTSVRGIFFRTSGLDKTGSVALGVNNVSCGYGSYVEGVSNASIGHATHVEGNGNTASGDNSHAEGKGNVSSGTCSHSEGTTNTASGANAHVEGNNNTASGTNSHAEGSNSRATNFNSHAGGSWSTSAGTNSFAHGEGVRAMQQNQTVIGQYNNNKADTLFEVGNGTGDTSRKNSFEVLKGESACVLYSPDGSRWKITVTNNGSLVATKI